MSVEDDIERAGSDTRKKMLAAAEAIGVDAAMVGARLGHLILGAIPIDGGQSVKVNAKLQAQAVEMYIRLTAAEPKRTQRVHATSDQRILKVTVADGQLPGVSLDALKREDPETRRIFLETLKRVRIGAGDDEGAAALPPGQGEGSAED